MIIAAAANCPADAITQQLTCTMPERSRRVRKVRPACVRRSATQPQSRTLRPASSAPSSPHSVSRCGHCRGRSLSGLASATSSGGVAAATEARVRSGGGMRSAEAAVVGERGPRRCEASGLGLRRESSEGQGAKQRGRHCSAAHSQADEE
jgi:hypothetical protein